MDFVFDLDGTICFKGQRISRKISNGLLELKRQGHRIIFASARPIRDLLPVLPEEFHDEYLIGGNGSLISHQSKILSSESFSDRLITKLTEWIQHYHLTYLIDGEWDYAYTGPDHHPILQNVDPHKLAKNIELNQLQSIIKVLILSCKQKESLIEQLLHEHVTIHLHQGEDIIDLSPPGISKWNALQKIGVRQGEFIAFGNDSNDICMFKEAKQAVMVGHHQELSTYATQNVTVEEMEGNIDEILKKAIEIGR